MQTLTPEGHAELLRLYNEVLIKYPEIERTAQRVNEGLQTFGQRMLKKLQEEQYENRGNIQLSDHGH